MATIVGASLGKARSSTGWMMQEQLPIGLELSFRALAMSHFRQAWVTEAGIPFDAIHYGILRKEWINQTITPLHWHDAV
jgi:hypothetical protein